ncbi:MAG: hypothetical protein P1V51_07970 [Deltaproteobacteria bacterium]|nr:hypothetical protein [Deltaproteobacteria bacterium]
MSARRTLAALLLLSGLLCLPPGRAAAAPLENLGLPWDRLSGQVGHWVRYRVGRTGETGQYLRLAVVGEEEGQLWLELSVSHLATAAAPGLATRLAVSRGADGGLLTRRMIISFNGSAPIEVEPEPEEDAGSGPSLAEQQIPICREGGGPCPPGSVRWRRLAPESRMSPLGSLEVAPLELTTAEGTLLRYELSEAIPLTGLLSADTPQAGRLELDAVGQGAVRTVGEPVKKVPGDQLAAALTSSTPALSALGRMGMLLDPEARQAARESAAAEAATASGKGVTP